MLITGSTTKTSMHLARLFPAYIKDGQVEENEQQLEAYAQQALQLAHNSLSVL